MQDSLYPLDDAGKCDCATEPARVMVFTGNAVSALLEVAVCCTGVRPEGREEMSSLPVLWLLPCYTCTSMALLAPSKCPCTCCCGIAWRMWDMKGHVEA